jgi:murein L,D-transpeptidase YcbB/YkuD
MKKPLVALAMAAVSLFGAVSLAPTASAADGYCSKQTDVWRSYNKMNYKANVPATGSGSTSCLMQQGSSGDHVRALQWALLLCQGKSDLTIDGIWGPKTTAAVQSFQRSKNLRPDGIYGPETRNALNWYFLATTGTDACWHL